MRDTAPDVRRVATAVSAAPGLVTRLQYPLLALALVIFLILGWRGREPIHIGTNDENIYVMLSRALESGSYREIHLASAPLHVKYPPGYPALLAAVRLAGGDNLDLVRAVNLVILAASILFTYLIVRHVASVGIALSLAFLLAVNHALLNVGGTVLSESFFLGLAAAALCLTMRADAGRDRMVYWAIGLALAAFLTRTAGIALVAGIGVWLLGRRRRPELVVYAVTSVMVVGGWLTYTSLVPGGRSYGMDVVAGLGGGSDAHPVLHLIQTVWRNLLHYGVRTLPTLLGVPTLAGTTIDNLAWLGANTVLVSVGTFVLWKRARAFAAYLVLYAGLLLAWPWLQSRVVVPFIPLALAALLVGAYHLTSFLPALARNAAVATLVLLLGFGGIKATLRRDALVRKCDLANPYESAGCLDPGTRGVGRAALFIREHAPPDAVVLTLEAAGVNYVSGHLTERPGILGGVPNGQVLQRLRDLRIQYVLLSGQTNSMVGTGRLLLPSCRELRVAGHFSADVTLLTIGVPGLASQDACPVLGALVNSPSPVEE